MFGSLLAVVTQEPAQRQKLADNWWKIIRTWYPEMHRKVYCIPQAHFNAISYGAIPLTKEGPLKHFPVHKAQPAQISKVAGDEAQQRALWTFFQFLQQKGAIAFVLSNLCFQDFLNKGYDVVGKKVPSYIRPDIKGGDEGEVDILIFDKTDGVFALEVKSIGYDHEERKPNDVVKIQVCVQLLLFTYLT